LKKKGKQINKEKERDGQYIYKKMDEGVNKDLFFFFLAG
jgi:hypothetical protein